MDSTASIGATRHAGSRVNRVEGARLLTGHGTFVDDITRPRMLHACLVRSPFARARMPGPGPGGYEGVGEGGAIGVPPAVINAVADALAPFGVSITRLPVTPPAVLALIDAAGKGSTP